MKTQGRSLPNLSAGNRGLSGGCRNKYSGPKSAAAHSIASGQAATQFYLPVSIAGLLLTGLS